MTTSNTEVDGLTRLATNPARHRVAIADILDAMGDNSVMMLMLLFALPNAVPAPPGTSTILGLPLLFLTLQWLRGKQPWVPRWIARQSLRRSDFAAITKRLARFPLMLLGFVAAIISAIVAIGVVIGMWRIGDQLLALARF